MINRKRLILYIVSFVFLVLLTTIIILTGKGYYFDFASQKIKKQGMIFLKSIPKSANIYFDNKYKKNKTPLNISTSSGSHGLRVEKDDYITWQKQVNVEEGLVTWVEYIFLIPQNRKVDSITTDGIKSFRISPDYAKVAFVDKKNNIWTADIKTNEQKRLYAAKEQDKNAEIISFSQNNKNLLVKRTLSDGSIAYYLVSDNGETIFKNIPGEIKKIEFMANSDDKLFALVNTNLYYLTKDGASVMENNISAFSQSLDNIFFAKNTDTKSEIWQAGLDFRTKNKLLAESSQKINLFSSKKGILVYTVGDENYLFYWKNNQKEKINSGVLDVQWGKDDKKIVYKTREEIDVYTFEPENPRESNNQITTRLSKNIDQISWFFDSKHIVFRVGSEINLIENDGDNSTTLTNSAANLNVFTTTKLGKSLIFAEDKDGLINIKVMKLSD